jgi:hypothetical protein
VLRRVVNAPAREGELAAHRADVDDPPLALAAHPGEDQLAHPDQAEDIGLELTADALDRDGLDRPRLAVAGVVDEGPNRPIGRLDRVDAGLHRGLVGDVACERLAALGLQVLDRLRSAGGRIDLVPAPGQGPRRLVPDPRRATGDQDDLRLSSHLQLPPRVPGPAYADGGG